MFLFISFLSVIFIELFTILNQSFLERLFYTHAFCQKAFFTHQPFRLCYFTNCNLIVLTRRKLYQRFETLFEQINFRYYPFNYITWSCLQNRDLLNRLVLASKKKKRNNSLSFEIDDGMLILRLQPLSYIFLSFLFFFLSDPVRSNSN